MCSPTSPAPSATRHAAAAREREVGGDERGEPGREHEPAIDPVGERAGRRRGARRRNSSRSAPRGSRPAASPTSRAQQRNASLKRASVNTAPIAATRQNAASSERRSARLGCTAGASARRARRAAPRRRSRAARRRCAPGTMATAEHRAQVVVQGPNSAIASSGPMNAPTVSSAWRNPKRRRALGGRHVGHERIARRAADPLSDAVDESRREQPGDAGRTRTPAWSARPGRSRSRRATCAGRTNR